MFVRVAAGLELNSVFLILHVHGKCAIFVDPVFSDEKLPATVNRPEHRGALYSYTVILFETTNHSRQSKKVSSTPWKKAFAMFQ